MTVHEFYMLYDDARQRDPDIDYAGTLNDYDCENLYRMLH